MTISCHHSCHIAFECNRLWRNISHVCKNKGPGCVHMLLEFSLNKVHVYCTSKHWIVLGANLTRILLHHLFTLCTHSMWEKFLNWQLAPHGFMSLVGSSPCITAKEPAEIKNWECSSFSCPDKTSYSMESWTLSVWPWCCCCCWSYLRAGTQKRELQDTTKDSSPVLCKIIQFHSWVRIVCDKNNFAQHGTWKQVRDRS